jgi:hypothetical protein
MQPLDGAEHLFGILRAGKGVTAMLKSFKMIPNSWSDEQNQNCKPNLSVHPANPGESWAPPSPSAILPALRRAVRR